MEFTHLSNGVVYKSRVRKTQTPDEIFDFYMHEGHWLFMATSRMTDILMKLKNLVSYRKDYDRAIQLLLTTPEEMKKEMQKIYLVQNKE